MSKDKNIAGAHGLTAKAQIELHRQQANEESAETVKANGPDADGYRVDKAEAHIVHVQLEIPQFDSLTGARLSKPFVQKFGVKEFEAAKENGGFTGYAVKVLHSPAFAPVMDSVADAALVALQAKYEAITGDVADDTLSYAQLLSTVRTIERFSVKSEAAVDAPVAEPVAVAVAVEEVEEEAPAHKTGRRGATPTTTRPSAQAE